MNQPYQDSKTAQKYLDFLNSENGKIQQEALFKSIIDALPKNPELLILDAGCGPGWLAGMLKKQFTNVEACDDSEFFINFAGKNYPEINFKQASLNQALPYQTEGFDIIILNMVGPDLQNLNLVTKNLAAILKLSGKILMTIPNPELTYPAAQWKRSFLDLLLGRKPKLKINSAFSGKNIQREFGKNIKISSNFYSLADYITAAKKVGLKLINKQEIKSQTDSSQFDLNYQMFRYPLILMLEFTK